MQLGPATLGLQKYAICINDFIRDEVLGCAGQPQGPLAALSDHMFGSPTSICVLLKGGAQR